LDHLASEESDNLKLLSTDLGRFLKYNIFRLDAAGDPLNRLLKRKFRISSQKSRLKYVYSKGFVIETVYRIMANASVAFLIDMEVSDFT